MKKTLIISCILIYGITTSVFSFSLSGEDKNPLYRGEVEKILRKKNALFNLNFDVQIGFGISSVNYDLVATDTSVNELRNTNTKFGPSVGAILSVDFLGYGFTTGFQYSNKGFESSSSKTNLNYFNIPLLIYFGFEAGKILIDGNLGPYFGLLLSQDENDVIPVKNFDLGLTGNLQGAYMFSKYLGALLGFKYEYGGLNNLGSNEKVRKITSSTFNIYSGLKFRL